MCRYMTTLEWDPYDRWYSQQMFLSPQALQVSKDLNETDASMGWMCIAIILSTDSFVLYTFFGKIFCKKKI